MSKAGVVSGSPLRWPVTWLLTLAVALPAALGDDEFPALAPLKTAPASPADNPTTPAKVALGKKLFFDPRLSGSNEMSCGTCHLPDMAFGDGLRGSKGADGQVLPRNTPGLLNAGYQKSFFWDGRAESLEAQALLPITSVEEMHQSLDQLEVELSKDPEYRAAFQAVYGTGVSQAAIAKSLAAYQRTLWTPGAPFDRYLAGDDGAISADAKDGLRLFQEDAGCIRCHNGPLLSDGKFYRLGVSFRDRGRGEVSGRREDDYKFRTPSLRNVSRTAPYMHNGSLATLDDVVQFYFRGVPTSGPAPLDVEPLVSQSFSDIPLIVAFLETLTADPADGFKP